MRHRLTIATIRCEWPSVNEEQAFLAAIAANPADATARLERAARRVLGERPQHLDMGMPGADEDDVRMFAGRYHRGSSCKARTTRRVVLPNRAAR